MRSFVPLQEKGGKSKEDKDNEKRQGIPQETGTVTFKGAGHEEVRREGV